MREVPTLQEEADNLDKYANERYKEKAKHSISTQRLRIAKVSIYIVGTLLLLCLILLYLLDIEDKHFILQTFTASLFSLLALIIGFVAGSSIDK